METTTPENAAARGFAAFNHYPHLCLEIPDGGFTVTCQTSTGHKITVSFVPYKKGAPPSCVDVKYHGRTDTDAPPQEVICFGAGKTPFRSNAEDPVTLTTILLSECES